MAHPERKAAFYSRFIQHLFWWRCRIYQTTAKTFIPLPDPDTAPGSLSHPNSYPEFPAGSTVLALYPDTSCFYRAFVMEGPRDIQASRVRHHVLLL